jgi:hypothetical protein
MWCSCFGSPSLSPARRIDVDLRLEALRAFRIAVFESRHNSPRTQKALLDAQRLLVEAFLEDRKENARFFVWAHRIGAMREERGECTWTHNPDRDAFSLECPMQAIHSRVGVSVALMSRHKCSVCGAGDFGCEHVAGEVYDGVVCEWRQTDIWLDHVAITQNPDFSYTFHNSIPLSRNEIEEELGQKWQEGDALYATHCRDCYGKYFARPDDIDTSLWESIGGAMEASEEPAG